MVNRIEKYESKINLSASDQDSARVTN